MPELEFLVAAVSPAKQRGVQVGDVCLFRRAGGVVCRCKVVGVVDSAAREPQQCFVYVPDHGFFTHMAAHELLFIAGVDWPVLYYEMPLLLRCRLVLDQSIHWRNDEEV